jgi:predicted secreted protein
VKKRSGKQENNMQENYKDILSNLSTDIDQETLLLYLQGKLSDEKKHEVEKQLLNNDFDEDAVEGLQEFKDKEQLQYMVEMLNRDLKTRTEKKKKRREKMKIKDQPWLYISIIILFILIAISYMVIKKMMQP